MFITAMMPEYPLTPVSGVLVDANTTGDAAQGETVETFGSDVNTRTIRARF